MLAIVIAAFMAAAAPSPLEVARDKQDRPVLTDLAAQAGAAAAKTPNDPEVPYRAALAYSYLAEVALELRDRKGGRQFAEQGIKFAEKTVALKPENAEYHRLLGTLYGQAVTDIMSGLTYGPKAKDAINKAVEKAPKSSMMYVARGVGNYYVPAQLGGGAKLSIPDFQKAIELDPRNAEAYLWLGLSLRKENRDAEARQAFVKSLELNPNRVWAKQQLEKTPAK
jgi:tetratricopeptide (TPR) repeat protein